MQRGDVRDPIKVMVLGMVTCGLYSVFWLYAICREINEALGREEFSFFKEIALSVVTCGIWSFYFVWRLSNATAEVQQRFGLQPKQQPALLFAFWILVSPLGVYLTQDNLNNAWKHGAPGAGGIFRMPPR